MTDSSPTTEAGREPNPEVVRRITAHLWGEDLVNLRAAVEGFANGWTVVDKDAVQQARDEGRREAVREIRERLPGYMDDLNSEEAKGYNFAIDTMHGILDDVMLRVAGLNASESPPEAT